MTTEDQALKAASKPILSPSLEQAGPNQVLAHDQRGQVVSSRKYSWLLLRHWLLVGVTSLLTAFAALQLFSSRAAALLVGLATLGFFVYARQRGRGQQELQKWMEEN